MTTFAATPLTTPSTLLRFRRRVRLTTDDEDLLDEAALRALVSEIIRKELQGTLGERITRNVRKLVRREIQRALSSQEFD